ncbi:MAG: HAMP domain-containing histidine kinase [Burkholderiales bacterium]|nr:HAMP domain-containing histidine kinase [Burkholderiales bacterium]
MLIRFALGFSLFETLVLAGVLLAWADRVAGGRLLAAFLIGIAVWITGNELPNWFGLGAAPVALRLMAMAPFVSAFFFHFCVVFCRVPLGRGWVVAGYALGGTASLLAQVWRAAEIVWFEPIGWIAIADPVGWAASVAWIVLGVAGVAVLLRGFAQAQPPVRQQIAAVTASCLWGLVCLSGYGLVLLHLPVYPAPLLLLPLYPVILVYGILRWGVFVANAWAGRALVWALLLAVGVAIVALMPLLLPFESRWLNGLAVAVGCLALSGPVRRFVQRLVYPGGEASAADLQAWREALLPAETLDELGTRANQLLSARLGTAVEVVFDAETAPILPRLNCHRAPWRLSLEGWSAAPPGQRHLAELFGSLVLEAAVRVEQAQQLAARERERQLQARLAELGALAATVAHDIRNPLNIISMAVATADTDTRREVADQVDRIAHLTRDLLDYAKPWKLSTAEVDVAELVRRVARRAPEVELGAGLQQPLPATQDARRVEQALTNLVENARTASSGAIHIDAERDGSQLKLHVCDNGPGVPDAIRERLFEPFASRSPGGTGLGLAIVARVMAAHGGTAALTERPGWRTCFTLSFPDDTQHP